MQVPFHFCISVCVACCVCGCAPGQAGRAAGGQPRGPLRCPAAPDGCRRRRRLLAAHAAVAACPQPCARPQNQAVLSTPEDDVNMLVQQVGGPCRAGPVGRAWQGCRACLLQLVRALAQMPTRGPPRPPIAPGGGRAWAGDGRPAGAGARHQGGGASRQGGGARPRPHAAAGRAAGRQVRRACGQRARWTRRSAGSAAPPAV